MRGSGQAGEARLTLQARGEFRVERAGGGGYSSMGARCTATEAVGERRGWAFCTGFCTNLGEGWEWDSCILVSYSSCLCIGLYTCTM